MCLACREAPLAEEPMAVDVPDAVQHVEEPAVGPEEPLEEVMDVEEEVRISLKLGGRGGYFHSAA